MFIVHNSYLWARDKSHAFHESGCRVTFSFSATAEIVRDIAVSPCLLSDRLTHQ
jgi:trimethylamine:corrinoid methyltransferase-like protein